jgi:hypothetical protein
MQRHPAARGAVCNTVATGCAGSTPALCSTPATRGRSSAGRARRWQSRRRGLDPAVCTSTTPCPHSSRDKAPACEAGGRRFKSSRGTRTFALAGDGQERVRQQGQGDVPVPAGPAADLVVVQADLGLGDLEAFLDRPPCPGHPNQPDQRGGGWANRSGGPYIHVAPSPSNWGFAGADGHVMLCLPS